MSKLLNGIKGDSNPGSHDCESGILPLSHRAPPNSSCNHEEFDTRVMMHAANAVSHGYKRRLIIANDIDVIVLRISFFGDIGADKLWV